MLLMTKLKRMWERTSEQFMNCKECVSFLVVKRGFYVEKLTLDIQLLYQCYHIHNMQNGILSCKNPRRFINFIALTILVSLIFNIIYIYLRQPDLISLEIILEQVSVILCTYGTHMQNIHQSEVLAILSFAFINVL